jgi:flagellar protein FlaJ
MPKIAKKTRVIVAAVSVVCLFLILLVPLLVLPFETYVLFLNELLFVGILVAIIPSAILDFINQRWLRSIEIEMPRLVRGIAESQETGLTVIKALDKVIEDKMVRPPLSDEIKRISVQMSWGASLEDALATFKNRVRSPVVGRFCALVLEASRSGGEIRKVFSATSGFMEDMKDLNRDTDSQMRPYVLVIYVAFAVSLFTAIILVQSFFIPLEGSPQIGGGTVIAGVDVYSDFFYKNMMMSAVTGGLMAGKLGERRVVGGFKHAILMIVIGYVIFLFLIPPLWT